MVGALDILEHRLEVQALIRSLSNDGSKQDLNAAVKEMLEKRAEKS